MIATSRTLADPLFRALVDAFPPERDYPLSAFDREAMPPLVVHYLSQYLAYRLDREVGRLFRQPKTAWFNFEHADVREAQQRLKAAMTHHVHIPAVRWRHVLHQAVQDVTAYLAQPQHTLSTFIFNKERMLPVAVVDRRMGYFAAYPYFREEVELFVARRNVKKMDQEQFEELLQRIDHEVAHDLEPEEWLEMLEPLFAMQPYFNNRRGLHVKWLESFFIEKEARDIVHYLRRHRDLENGRWMDEALVLRVLQTPDVRETVVASSSVMSAPIPDGPARPDALVVSEDVPESEMEEHVPPPPVMVQQPIVMQPNAPVVAEPPSSEPVPLWKQFQKGLKPDAPAGTASPRPAAMNLPDTPPHGIDSVSVQEVMASSQQMGVTSAQQASRTSPQQTRSPQQTSGPSAQQSGVPLWKQYHAEQAPPEESPDLAVLERSVLGPSGTRNRALFVEELFAGSVGSYQQTLNRLLGAPGWPEASKIIAEDVFRAYEVNIYSDPAVMFTDAVELRYRQ